MNDDLISRQKAIDILDAYQVMVENGEGNPYAWARLRMSELPPAQPKRKKKKGRWIVQKKGCKLTSYKCSKCGRYIIDDTGYDVKKDYPFCHCGADMREDTDE
jgi:hypothetical protein